MNKDIISVDIDSDGNRRVLIEPALNEDENSRVENHLKANNLTAAKFLIGTVDIEGVNRQRTAFASSDLRIVPLLTTYIPEAIRPGAEIGDTVSAFVS